MQPPSPVQGEGYTLIKDWDVGATVKTMTQLRDQFYTRSIYNNGALDTLNDEWERYRDNGNQELGGHVLKLTARAPGGLTSGGIESGMLRSKWTGEYGYYECRMKVLAGRGMWPAFWLNPEDARWPPEIDVMEIVNNGRDTTRNSYHIVPGGKTVRHYVDDVLVAEHRLHWKDTGSMTTAPTAAPPMSSSTSLSAAPGPGPPVPEGIPGRAPD